MAEDKGAVDEFLNSLKGEEDPLKAKNDNPLEDLSNLKIDNKQEEEVEEKEEEKPLPFHKDPKIQRYIQKEIAKATEGLSRSQKEEVQTAVSDEEEDLVAAFTNIIGNDTPEKVHALKMLGKTIENIREEAQSVKKEIEEERIAEVEAMKELEEGFSSVEDNFEVDLSSDTPGAKKMRTDFINFIERVAPKDQYGEVIEYPDFNETFALFQELRKKTPAPNTRARQLAARSMTNSADASSIPEVRDTSWKGVEKFFQKLKE